MSARGGQSAWLGPTETGAWPLSPTLAAEARCTSLAPLGGSLGGGGGDVKGLRRGEVGGDLCALPLPPPLTPLTLARGERGGDTFLLEAAAWRGDVGGDAAGDCRVPRWRTCRPPSMTSQCV